VPNERVSLGLADPRPDRLQKKRRQDLVVVSGVAAAFAIFHILTNGRYGFHRDELQFLSDARHLDWGFVAYPPFTPFIERIGFSLFGLSLVGLRLFSVIAQAVVILVAGVMARDLGGGRLAQVAASVSVGLSGLPLFEATEFQYTSFSFLWWVLVCWFTIRLLTTEDPRWWIGIGSAIGLGLMTKYSLVFFVAGLLVGLVLSPARRYFGNRWFWAGLAVTLVMVSPNLLWLIRHDFVSYHFLQSIHARDVREGRANGFWAMQLLVDSISTFCVLGRHALLLSGNEARWTKAEVVAALEAALGRPLSAFNEILAVRESGRQPSGAAITSLLERYLVETDALVRFVDALEK